MEGTRRLLAVVVAAATVGAAVPATTSQRALETVRRAFATAFPHPAGDLQRLGAARAASSDAESGRSQLRPTRRPSGVTAAATPQEPQLTTPYRSAAPPRPATGEPQRQHLSPRSPPPAA